MGASSACASTTFLGGCDRYTIDVRRWTGAEWVASDIAALDLAHDPGIATMAIIGDTAWIGGALGLARARLSD